MVLSNNNPLNLSIVVPVYNNSATLNLLYEQIESVLIAEGITFEIIFVDDCSQDDSVATAKNLVANNREVTLITLSHNIGQHKAVMHGLRSIRGECAVIMDADLQDPPAALAVLWKNRREDGCAVFAGRAGQYQNAGRMVTSKIFKYVLHKLTGIPKNAGIFVLLERTTVDRILSMRVKTPFINVMVGLSRVEAISIPVKRSVREQGRSAYTKWRRLQSALNALRCVLQCRIARSSKSYFQTLDVDPVNGYFTRSRTGERG